MQHAAFQLLVVNTTTSTMIRMTMMSSMRPQHLHQWSSKVSTEPPALAEGSSRRASQP